MAMYILKIYDKNEFRYFYPNPDPILIINIIGIFMSIIIFINTLFWKFNMFIKLVAIIVFIIQSYLFIKGILNIATIFKSKVDFELFENNTTSGNKMVQIIIETYDSAKHKINCVIKDYGNPYSLDDIIYYMYNLGDEKCSSYQTLNYLISIFSIISSILYFIFIKFSF